MDIQKTVLVVDDSTTNRSILCDILHSDFCDASSLADVQAVRAVTARAAERTSARIRLTFMFDLPP